MFSIVLPVYNGEKFIDSAVESILRQTFEKWELIIVNDGSRDNTKKALEKYSCNPKITVISQENKGVSAARNKGMETAKHSHIAFLDADDVWHENHLEVMARLIKKYPRAGLYGSFTVAELVNGKEISSCNYFDTHKEEDVLLNDFFAEYHKDKSVKMFTVITTCVKKDMAIKVGGFPEGCTIGEDLELSLKIAAYSPVALTRIATATYQKMNSTATKTKSFDPEWGFFEKAKVICADESISAEKRHNIEKVMQWFTMRRIRHYLINGEREKARRIFKAEKKDAVSFKDNAINFVLLLLPTVLVRKIFEKRWRGKA